MRKYFLFLVILFFSNKFYAQNSVKVDEIKKNYKIGLESLQQKNYEKAFELFSVGLKKAKKNNYRNLIAHGYFNLAIYHQKKKNYLEGVASTKKSFLIFKELNDEEEVYNCYFKLGFFYSSLDQYDKSLENYFAALKIAETNNDEPKIAINLEKIGEVYLLTPNLEKAKNNFYKAIEIFTKLDNELHVMFNLTNLGASYQKEGSRNNKPELVEKAIEIFKIGLGKAKKLGEKRSESIFLGNIGSSYRFLNDYEESLRYLFMALPIKLEQERYKSAAHTCNDISETYIEMKDLSKAKEYATKAINYAKGYSLHQERYAYYLMSKIDSELGNYKVSLVNLKKYHQLQDSLFSIDKIANIDNLQIKYETEKKNLKIEAQKSNIALLDAKNKVKNQWLLFGTLGFLLLFTVFVLLKSKNTAKKEKEQQEKFSQDLLQSQEEERTRIARELHDSVGQQLTLIKRKSQNLEQEEITKMTNNALEEVRSISRGLYPALLKELGLTESIEQLVNEYDEQTNLFFLMDIENVNHHFTEITSLNYYRLIQECLTNIVKHAKAKSVIVTIKREEDSIITLISDNGKGFDVNESKKKNSLGLKTIFERIKIMNGNISIDSKLNNGTSFLFSIPVKNES